jgi:dienelactone hydrolase
VLDGVDGEGLLLEPKGKAKASIVALPDADWTPEMLVGLAPGVPAESQFARRLAESGCRVVVPVLIDRKDTWSGNPRLGRLTNQPHREFIYRMAYQMGRHIIGYEIQKVLNLVSWFARDLDHPPVGVIGYGEGGLIALYSGALEPRIQVTVVSGYPFDHRHKGWEEPIYRNVWSLLPEFRDEQLRYLFLNRGGLFYEHSLPPKVDGPPTPRDGHRGAAPGRITAPEEVLSQLHKIEPPGVVMQATVGGPEFRYDWRVMTPPNGEVGYAHVLNSFLINLRAGKLADLGTAPTDLRKDFVPGPRQKRQFDQLVAFTQKLMRDSEARRAETFWAKLDMSSLEKYQASCEPFRKQLWEEVIGKLPGPTEPMNPRSRQIYDEPKWRGYEVTLALYPDVFAYGILLLPKDLKPGEKRPVVVCQHGLEGRPTDVCNPREKSRYYNSFGAQLADKGYIVFAPQNPYIGQDKFRVLQRKANPLGLSLFSFIIRQHERILDWLATLPNVDADKMAFYGLSYGGKTAMRVPAILPRYCLSICSGDFNEWTWKNVSVDFRGSYMFTGEYEMPEFNLGSTMVYAEMAALIAPRPFMVERGHDDGVGIDEWVAYEYAKVRRHYSRLKISERTAIEFFSGGHEIHGQGTFAFLQKHLGYPTPTKNGE